MGSWVINWRSPRSVTGWSPARTSLDWERVGEISTPRVRARDTQETGARRRMRRAVERCAEAQCPASGALSEGRISGIAAPTSVAHHTSMVRSPPPCRGLGRGLKFNATKARAGKPAPFLKVRPMVVRITSLPGLGSARWSTRSGHSKQAGRARPHLGRDGGITTAATWEDPRLPWWLLRRQRPRTPAGVNGTTDMPPSRPSRFSPARESLTSPFVARTSARRRTRHGFTVP
jgi:hypothetical protein